MEDIKFKVKGIDRLVTFSELKRLPLRYKMMPIGVINLKNQHNYKAGYRSIIKKFR